MIGRHALRNSLIVVVTIVGLQLGGLISGAVVTEQIFGLPGFGKMTIDAVFQRDYPVIQAVVLLTATAYIVINFWSTCSTRSSIHASGWRETRHDRRHRSGWPETGTGRASPGAPGCCGGCGATRSPS